MANWFKKAMNEAESIGNMAGNAGEAYVKSFRDDPIKNALSGGLYSGFKAGQSGFKDYQYNNGGRAAEGAMAKAEADAGLAAGQVAAKKMAVETTAAGSRYGGGDAFSSLTNSSIMSPNKKKSILGGF